MTGKRNDFTNREKVRKMTFDALHTVTRREEKKLPFELKERMLFAIQRIL